MWLDENGRWISKSSAQPRRRDPTFAPPPARPVVERTLGRLAMGVRARGARPAPPGPRSDPDPAPIASPASPASTDETRATGTDLPPGARGGADGAKGSVELTLRHLEWTLRGAPPWVRVAARWWGDEGVEKSKRPWVRLVPGGDAVVAFPVKAKPSGFSRYCRDAVAVVLEFSDGRTGRLIAAASVDVSRLDVRRPVDVQVPLVSRAGAPLGRVHARVVVDYLPDAVSSFELNEHLAKIDDALPLAPNPRGLTPKTNRARRLRADPNQNADANQNATRATPTAANRYRDADAPDESTWWYGGPITPQPPTPRTCTPGGPGPVPSESPAKPTPRVPRRIPRVAGKENQTEAVGTPPSTSTSTLRLVDRRRLEAKSSKARAVAAAAAAAAAVEGEGLNRSDGFGSAAGTSSRTDPVLAAAEALREEMDEALAFDAEAAERALDESTAGSHARLMQLIRGVMRATAGTDGEEDEGLEGRGGVARDDDDDDDDDGVARESTASERAAAAAWLREDDDAARVVDEALLEELFFAESGAFDVNDDDDGEDDDADAAGDVGDAAPSPETTAAVARASACSLVDAQLSAPNTTPDVEIRLTAHVGLVRALDPLSLVPADDAESLVAILKGGHPFPAGELARVTLAGPGPRGAGVARIALTREVIDAVVDGPKPPGLVLELWSPDAADDADDDEDAVDAGVFAQLFGDFASADPAKMRGVAAVPLVELANDLRRARRRAEENRRWGLEEEEEDESGRAYPGSYPLNRVFEARNPIAGGAGGYVGVEARVVGG